jgi:hypothetical protein
MRPLLAALLLLPAAGFAQSGIVLTLNGAGTSNTLARNALNGCGTLVAGGWVGTGLTTACTSLQIWVSANACANTPAATDYVFYTASTAQLTTGGLTKDSFSLSFNSLPSFTASSACGAVADFTDNVCASVQLNDTTNACTGTVVQGTPSPLTIRYDNIPPLPPTLTITPIDSQLSVRFAPSDATDTISYFSLQLAVELADGGTPTYAKYGGNVAANNPTMTISGLVNGTTYLVQGFSIDEATNQSVASMAYPGTPVVTYGFYANYLGDGGQPGGCGDAAGGGPSALALVSVLLLGLVRRRG